MCQRNGANYSSKPKEGSGKDDHWERNREEEDGNKRSGSEGHKRAALECPLTNSDDSLNHNCENGSLESEKL